MFIYNKFIAMFSMQKAYFEKQKFNYCLSKKSITEKVFTDDIKQLKIEWHVYFF